MKLILILLLIPMTANAENIFIAEQHPKSDRWGILEDNGNSTWLYLTKPGTQEPEKDSFVYSPIQPIDELNKKEIKEKGEPPILTKDLATSSSVIINAKSSNFTFLWSTDGNSLCVSYKGEPISMIVSDSHRGYSKAINQVSSFGLPWEHSKFETNFK